MPLLVIEKIPYPAVPAIPDRGTNELDESTSVADKDPEADSAAFASVIDAVDVPVITAASFVPNMVTVIVLLVRSAVVTMNESVYDIPAENSLCAVVIT